MLKIIQVLQCFPFLSLCLFRIHGREFIRCPNLNGVAREELRLLDLLLGSRLSCGTKCTEHKDKCWSYAWNKYTNRCMLYSERSSNESQTFQEENNCEHYTVQVPVLSDIALGKPAAQSSMYLNYAAESAVDGNRGTDIIQDLCSHTDTSDTNPWWRVDLEAVYSITMVRILNRGMDIYGIDVSDRLRDVTVTVGLTESDINTPCGFFAGPGSLSQLVAIDCPTSPFGRYVQISMTTEYLSLCEVDVFGVKV
eukprot:XP_011441433.2 PREDICTED: uncharacterized protein LOC105338136 [Crassostrea gigas]